MRIRWSFSERKLSFFFKDQKLEIVEEKKKESLIKDINIKNERRQLAPSDLEAHIDDEPLMSSTTGARFIPILESDENEEMKTGATDYYSKTTYFRY